MTLLLGRNLKKIFKKCEYLMLTSNYSKVQVKFNNNKFNLLNIVKNYSSASDFINGGKFYKIINMYYIL